MHKLTIARKEIRESRYWLLLVVDLTGLPEEIDSLEKEADELTAILSASIKTVNDKRRRD